LHERHIYSNEDEIIHEEAKKAAFLDGFFRAIASKLATSLLSLSLEDSKDERYATKQTRGTFFKR